MRGVRPNIAELRPSGIGVIAMLGFDIPDVTPLWFGESDLTTPAFIREAAKRALDDGETFYTYPNGALAFREAIRDYTNRVYGTKIGLERIHVPGAAMLGITTAVQCLAREGDNVVVVTPVWPNITYAAQVAGAEPRHVRLKRDGERWRLDMDELFDACDARTKALFFASPGNPTGWIMSEAEQRAALDFARARGIGIISDEVYGRIVYDRAVAPSFLTIAEADDLVFVVNSMSKAWAMTGWRLGWITGPAPLQTALQTLAEVNNTGATVFAQYGAIAALNDGEDFIAEMVARCAKARSLIAETFAGHNRIKPGVPDGAFYAFMEVEGVEDSLELAKKILYEAKVGVAPGSAFGPGNEAHIRLCFAQDPDRLAGALARIAACIDG